jgi:signal recognition particle subunit SRP54
VEQLQILGRQIDVPVLVAEKGQGPVQLAAGAQEKALDAGADVLIVDTAGRLAIDEALMEELKQVKKAVRPHEVLLVVDAMAGQDAVDTAMRFHQAVGVDGLILTKMDGDARGGAALSVLAVTGRPVKFVGQGEKVEALEPFYPDRLAGRILGMGDVVGLVERVQQQVDQEKAEQLAKKMGKNLFDFNDFLDQIAQIKKMGNLKDLMGMIPGMGKMKLPEGALDESMFKRTEAIIQSMTLKERRLPQIIHGERRKRIAGGSGTKVEDVNKVLKQFEQMKKMMKMMKKGGRRGGMMPGMGAGPGMFGGMGGMR